MVLFDKAVLAAAADVSQAQVSDLEHEDAYGGSAEGEVNHDEPQQSQSHDVPLSTRRRILRALGLG